MALPDGLLDDAKNALDITWDDQSTDRKLEGILERGIKYIDDKAGAELDYSEEGNHRELLFEYARYARDGKFSEFLTAYVHELSDLQLTQRMAEDV